MNPSLCTASATLAARRRSATVRPREPAETGELIGEASPAEAGSFHNDPGGLVLLLLSLAGSGCAADAPGPTFSVADSSGVEVITSHAPAWGDSTGWWLAPDPVLSIGTETNDPRYQLYQVVDVRRLADGRILVANAGTDELRLYGPEGAWIRNSGGTGEGPGEFRQISEVAVGGDSIWVWDLALAHVSVFNAAGDYARSIRLSETGEGPARRFEGRLSDGRLMVGQYVRFWAANPEPGVQPIVIRYQLADRDGKLLEELDEFELGVHLVQVRSGGVSSLSIPFGRRSYLAMADDGFLFGTGEKFEVLEYDSAGELRRIMRLAKAPQPSGPEDLEAWIEAVAARSESPDARRVLHERYADVPLPATKPTYLEAVVGESGDIWLKHFPLPGERLSRWTVFDSAGVHLGTMTMPEGFELHQVGDDFVLGVTTNELGVETVHVYSIDRGGH